jgi:hypothetical protein
MLKFRRTNKRQTMDSLEFLDNVMQSLISTLNRHDAKWIRRRRQIDTVTIFMLLVQQVGDGAKFGLRSILCRLSLLRTPFPSALSSISVARYKVGWSIFRKVLHLIVAAYDDLFDQKFRWKGHRLFAIDGSKINVPHGLKAIKYRASSNNSYYPLALVTTLFRLKSLMPYHFIVSRHLDELRDVKYLLRKLRAKDVVVYDRLYLTTRVLESHAKSGIHGVFRLRKGGTLKEVTDFIASGETDVVVSIDRKDVPKMKLRFLRYRISGKTYFIATTLLNARKYNRNAIKKIYHERWGVEEQYKVFKQTLKIEPFHSRKSAGMKQEIGVFLSSMLCPA